MSTLGSCGRYRSPGPVLAKWPAAELHACNLSLGAGCGRVAPRGGEVSRRSPFVIELSDEVRHRLELLARKQTAERRQVVRAQIVLAAADGEDNVSIAGRLGMALNTVIKWRKRFFDEGVDGLEDRKRPGRPRSFSPSGRRRGQGAGLRAAGHHRRATVALELRRAGPRADGPGGGVRHLGVHGVADLAR
ncbi:MAG: helix-turn-helix domain-containing protein [Acidimicrobiales bacterium]